MGAKRRRRSKSATIYLPIAALLILFLTVYGTSVFLKINSIEVIGITKYTSAEIIAASGISAGENLMLVDTLGAQRRICSALPYISEAKVTRSMPDTILIEVSESAPIAAIEHRGAVVIIDSSGKVLQHMSFIPSQLIEIKGFEPADAFEGSIVRPGVDSETKFNHMVAVLAAIEGAGIQSKVNYLDVTNIANISICYMDNFRVLIGGPIDVQYKMDLLPGKVEEILTEAPDVGPGMLNMSREPWRWEPDR
ncbi:MAG: FtsQ-type POTRA domain-containing protein [Oscillospiraceae bacterium]|nr:FtsQ-type POTRA domain-containing protein [Oscillospiraceae bacterium]